MTEASIEQMFARLRERYNYIGVSTCPGDGYTISTGIDAIGRGETLEEALKDAAKGDRR